VPGVRSDGVANSLDGATGGAIPGAGTAPIDGGLAVSSMGDAGAGRIGGGADRAGGTDCACAASDADAATTPARMIAQSFTARSPC
jgi:hypothetical protein